MLRLSAAGAGADRNSRVRYASYNRYMHVNPASCHMHQTGSLSMPDSTHMTEQAFYVPLPTLGKSTNLLSPSAESWPNAGACADSGQQAAQHAPSPWPRVVHGNKAMLLQSLMCTLHTGSPAGHCWAQGWGDQP